LSSLSSQDETRGNITHVNQIIGSSHIRLEIATREIKYELADVGDSVIPGTDNTGGTTDHSVKSSFSYFLTEKESAPSFATGIVTEHLIRGEGLRLIDHLAMGWLSDCVDGAGIDQATDSGSSTGADDIPYTSHVYHFKYGSHARHDGNDTREVKNDVSPLERSLEAR